MTTTSKTPAEIRTENDLQRELNIQKKELMDRSMERSNNLLNSWYISQDIQANEDFKRVSSQHLEHFQQNKIISFLFVGTMMFIAVSAIFFYIMSLRDVTFSILFSPLFVGIVVCCYGFSKMVYPERYKPLKPPISIFAVERLACPYES